MKFATKAVLFYAVSTIVSLVICAGLNVGVYCFLDCIGIPELGRSIAFMLAMAAMETSFMGFVVLLLAEDILYLDDKEEDDDEETEWEDVFGEL